MIFAPILPTANYEDVYFLEACSCRISQKENAVGNNFCDKVFWFIDYHRDRLGRDRLLTHCLGLMAALGRTYTADFDLMRLTDAELKEHRIRED